MGGIGRTKQQRPLAGLTSNSFIYLFETETLTTKAPQMPLPNLGQVLPGSALQREGLKEKKKNQLLRTDCRVFLILSFATASRNPTGRGCLTRLGGFLGVRPFLRPCRPSCLPHPAHWLSSKRPRARGVKTFLRPVLRVGCHSFIFSFCHLTTTRKPLKQPPNNSQHVIAGCCQVRPLLLILIQNACLISDSTPLLVLWRRLDL